MRRRTDAQWSHEPEDPLLERLTWLMDQCIRVGPWSIGLDGLLGLIPGFGDMAGGVVSALIIGRAMQAGLPRIVVLRMVANVGVDSLVGSVPFFGDLFDLAYKANVRNLDIYRQTVVGTRRPLKDWGFVLLVGSMLLAIIALPILALVYLARLIGPYMPAF